jgi:hypothetical protein
MTNFHPPWKYCLSCDLQSVRIFKLFLCLKRSKHCTFSNSIMYKASGENYKVREGTSFQNWHENKKYKEKGNLAHPNALLNYFHAKYLAFSTFLFKKVTEEQRHSFACSAPPPPFFSKCRMLPCFSEYVNDFLYRELQKCYILWSSSVSNGTLSY